MNSAFRMLLAAMIRARCVGSAAQLDQRVQRHAVEAAEQAEQHEVGHHAPVRGSREERRERQRRPDGVQRRASRSHRSTANTRHADRAEAAPGRSPPCGRDSRSHSSEPTPMPTENTTSSSDDDVLVAAQHLLGEAGNCVRNIAPKNHNQRDAEHRQEHRRGSPCASAGSPGLGERVPVDREARVGAPATAG